MRRLLARLSRMRVVRRTAVFFLLGRERLRSGVVYNPLSESLYADPYRSYARLRERDPVHYTGLLRGWVLSRHEHVDAVLRDHRRFSSDQRKSPTFRRQRQLDRIDDLLEQAGLDEAERERVRRSTTEPSLIGLDPPDHTRLRSLVNMAFTPRQVEALVPRIERLVDELLDGIDVGGPVDMIEALADPLPTVVIAEMLGVPIEDRAKFKLWSDAVARQLEPAITDQQLRDAFRAIAELREYFDAIIEQRRADPRDDLISAMIVAEEEGDKLTHEEMVATLVLLLVAGNETTTNLIGNGLLALLRHPDQLARLRDDPALMENAVEELLRYDSPVQTDGRTATEDLEIGGKQIKAGQQIVLLLGAANHDPEVFDDPQRLDLGRDAREHVSFARGNHYCLGSPLARVEAAIAFRRLFDRFSDLQLAAEPEFKDHIVLRGMHELWVDVTAAGGARRVETAAVS